MTLRAIRRERPGLTGWGDETMLTSNFAVREVTASNDHYVADVLIRQGERQRHLGKNRQDFGTVSSCDEGVVLVVADGVSCCAVGEDEVPSHNEAGAWLVGQVAGAAAIAALRAGHEDETVIDHVSNEVFRALHPIWSVLGYQEARFGLSTTLLVAVVRERSVRIYCSGDGCWGMVIPIGVGERWQEFEGRVTGEALLTRPGYQDGHGPVSERRVDTLIAYGSAHSKHHPRFASTEARHSAAAVRRELREVLAFEGPIHGVHVATDGLPQEVQLASLLRAGRVRVRAMAEGLIVRPKGCDDLAVAWAAARTQDLALVSLPTIEPMQQGREVHDVA